MSDTNYLLTERSWTCLYMIHSVTLCFKAKHFNLCRTWWAIVAGFFTQAQFLSAWMKPRSPPTPLAVDVVLIFFDKLLQSLITVKWSGNVLHPCIKTVDAWYICRPDEITVISGWKRQIVAWSLSHWQSGGKKLEGGGGYLGWA